MTNRDWLNSIDEVCRIKEVTLKLIEIDKRVSMWGASSNVHQRQVEKYGKNVVSGMFDAWLNENKE